MNRVSLDAEASTAFTSTHTGTDLWARAKQDLAQQGGVLPTLLPGIVSRDHARLKQDRVLKPVSEEQENVDGSVSEGDCPFRLPTSHLKELPKPTESGWTCQGFNGEAPVTERTNCSTCSHHSTGRKTRRLSTTRLLGAIRTKAYKRGRG